MAFLVDRRFTSKNKNAGNRQRFIERYKGQLRKHVEDVANKGTIKDNATGGNVEVKITDIAEPSIGQQGGDSERVLPGNKKYVPGDKIPREGGSGGSGGEGSGDGQGDGEGGSGQLNEYSFVLSRDEFLAILFDDMELPRLMRRDSGDMAAVNVELSGYARNGSPSRLSVKKTVLNAIGRRKAVHASRQAQIDDLVEAIEAVRAAGDGVEALRLETELAELKARFAAHPVPGFEDHDVRYRNFDLTPEPITKAVVFFLMDSSGSMDEGRVNLAKRFFSLLYHFLSVKYEGKVAQRFISHTETAEEVDEKTFFGSRENGGTVVFSALELTEKIMREDYGDGRTNVYIAQASDGDSFGADPQKSAKFAIEKLLPETQYFAYVETNEETGEDDSNLWSAYEKMKDMGNFSMRPLRRKEDVLPALRSLFAKETKK